jgi:hypothetical protein
MTRYKQHYFLTLLLLLAFCQVSLAQFQVVPLKNTEKSKPSSAKVMALSLPFFDDFSTSNNSQDLGKWKKGGGIYISNTFTTNHPTINVATFDGLQANGTPYDFANSLAEGATDSLTSLPIDLQYSVADSVHFTFFYRTQGLGDKPELRDSLRLQFLTNGDKWQTVWVGVTDTSKTANDLFKRVIIPIRANLFLHDKFQFSFQSFGRKSGQFDVWHVDYIYIDKIKNQRTVGEIIKNTSIRNPITKEVTSIITQDLATQNQLTSFLKRYNSMPLRQLLANPQKELADSIKWNVNNLSSILRFFPYSYQVTNLLNNQNIESNSLPSQGIGSLSTLTLIQKNNLNLASLNATKLKLKVSFKITSSDVSPFAVNDTISRVIDLDNYYAYDDGTAEKAAYLGKGFGRAAVQFIVNKPDAVKAIRINVQPTVTSLAGKRLTLQILANEKGKPGKALKTIADSTTIIKYPNTPNAFIEYKFDSVAVVDTFYVGYVQLADDEPLTIGLDENSSQFVNRHFYNINNEWVNVSTKQSTSLFTPIKGSLMIRPVMVGKEIFVLANEEEIEDKSLVISPNPSKDIFKWNDSSLKNVELLDMTGRTILQTRTDNQEVNLQNLNTGTYLLRLSNDKNTFVRKIIKE